MAGLPGVGRGGPGDRQAVSAVCHSRDHGRRGSAGRLVLVGDADGDVGDGSCGSVRGRDRDRVGGLGLVVVADAGYGADLPRGRHDVEGGHVGAAQRVAEGVAGVVVGGRHLVADVLTRGGVLRDGTVDYRRAEHRRVVGDAACGIAPDDDFHRTAVEGTTPDAVALSVKSVADAPAATARVVGVGLGGNNMPVCETGECTARSQNNAVGWCLA